MIKLICFLSIIVYANSASVKREEYNPDPLLASLTNQVNRNPDQSSVSSNNSPVYSQNGYPTYSSSYSSPAASNQNLAPNNYGSQLDANNAYSNNQAYADNNVASAASNLPASQQNNNQGNLYYYYYPVQDKNKEINYQASPSNQFTSSIVQPQSNEEQLNQNNANLVNNNQQSNSPANNAGHDLSYGAQDLAYTASALNENSNSNSNGGQTAGNNYADSQLNNLANTLSQYGFGSNSNGANAYSSQLANQFGGLNNLGGLVQGFGEAFGGSSQIPNNVPFVNDPAFASAMANQFGSFSPVASQSASSSSGGGPLSQLYQQASQMYQGLFNGATANSQSSQPQFAASQQHPSYEPSTGGSGFRAKYGTIGTLMMPLIALAGLSLLIPTVTSLSTVASRKKRSAEENLNLRQAGLGNYFEKIDRYYNTYNNAIDEECLNRIICEIGGAVSNVKGKEAFFDFIESMIPQAWMVKGSRASIFKSSAFNENNAKCIKYKCSFKNRQ